MGSLSVVLEINMNINRWFNGPPNLLDMKSLPAGIMQNEELMHKICRTAPGFLQLIFRK